MIKGVSLGPGDPELITVKGLNALKEADKIYFPGSLFSNGKQSSYSLSILDHYKLDQNKLVGFYLKMSLDRGLDLQDCEKDIYNNYRGRWSK